MASKMSWSEEALASTLSEVLPSVMVLSRSNDLPNIGCGTGSVAMSASRERILDSAFRPISRGAYDRRWRVGQPRPQEAAFPVRVPEIVSGDVLSSGKTRNLNLRSGRNYLQNGRLGIGRTRTQVAVFHKAHPSDRCWLHAVASGNTPYQTAEIQPGARTTFGVSDHVMRDDVQAIDWNIPTSRNRSNQRSAGRELSVRPDVVCPSSVLDAYGVEIGIDSWLQQLPLGSDHNSRVKGSVAFVRVLVNLSCS